MRVSRSKDDFEFNFNMAQRESANAFGDDTMYIEKYIENPRHVEIQIMADTHGNVVALGERDCSVQRNHQKLIEESPSPAITANTRASMNHDAVLAAKAVGYTNAGTIEFILDQSGTYYFMEMNTRIQVEHGVTEMVTGTDLIIEQIRVAMGEPLSFTQEEVTPRGHAIECRINAEIPEKNFMPSPGVVKHLHLPSGNGVRVDTGLYTGYRIPSEYDSMIAKVIVHAPDRDAAIQKMRSALDEMVILGVETNLDFHEAIEFVKHFPNAKIMLSHHAGNVPRGEGEALAERRKCLISCMASVAAKAAEAGIVCCFHPNSAKNSLFRTEEDYEAMFELIQPTAIGWAPDVGHIENGGMSAIEQMKAHRDLIRHVHFKDSIAQNEWAVMGEGKIDYPAIIKYLAETGYLGWIMVEDESPRAETDSDGVVAEDGKYMCRQIHR